MGRVKIVLLFNEDDERQKEAAEFLKTQKRCKTVLITELIQGWLHGQKDQTRAEVSPPERAEEGLLDRVKENLLSDSAFVDRFSALVSGKDTAQSTLIQKEYVAAPEASEKEDGLDMDEDMLLAGLSMFESQI